MNPRALSYLPFELAYLALLTRHGLKRLSRWEHRLSRREISILEDLGLHVVGVERKTLLGRRIRESVFSMNPHATNLYASRMAGRRLISSKKLVRFQGFLFGYPSCCVEEYIRHPYSKNDLSHEDQRILFHWACPGCKITPSLLPEYRLVHSECLRLFGGVEPSWSAREPKRNRQDTLDGRAPTQGCSCGSLPFSSPPRATCDWGIRSPSPPRGRRRGR